MYCKLKNLYISSKVLFVLSILSNFLCILLVCIAFVGKSLSDESSNNTTSEYNYSKRLITGWI